MNLDVVMVHYHAARQAAGAVAALRRDASAHGLTLRIFVVDNGSTADERLTLESLDAIRLDPGRNLNFPAGVQFGFAHTSAPFVVLMNEDVVVLPGCLPRLCDALDRGAAVAGPEFSWDLDSVFALPCTEERTRGNEFLKAAGRRGGRSLLRARTRWREHARRHWRATETMPTLSISGALLAFRREAWEIAGPFGQGYHMYFDENDWLLRIERAGLQSVYVPEAKAVHLHNPSLMGNGDRAQWASESFVRFGNRHYGETFMRRLIRLAGRPAAVPEWQPLDGGIDIPADAAWPVWIELTPSPFGYPAAAARITDRVWKFPELRGLPFLTGPLYVNVVDDAGRELGGYVRA